ncbi:hypothetical protein IQ22_02325 [Pseudomonas duriflava]|uniref:DUF2171 domain-containing protein n=1 Tax=Pseudomonas duriflava TaxID=459528 RepID=A0A562QC15_9PSED|nr:DUF2171 domain-containing protein [Pseudomonas duriflava]TWI53720.1 hypothetical protein IQ22_02325 [Pseudomonas duriflava]
MVDIAKIPVQADVLGSDGGHVGKVHDIVRPDRIKLAQDDPDAQGQYHVIPVEWVEKIEGSTLTLMRTREEAQRDWQSA